MFSKKRRDDANGLKHRKRSTNKASMSALIKKRWLNNLTIEDIMKEDPSLKGLRLYEDSRKKCKNRMRTPKRSFSSEDYKDEKSTQLNILRHKVRKINSIKKMLLQTVKRDPDTIRSNIIRNKNEFFTSSMSKYFSQSQNKKSQYKAGPSSIYVRNVRLNLLKYHIQNEIPKTEVANPSMLAIVIE
eukprot:TRINITY_DN12207_c0_g1_i1.p2 TRINITY_DN12207_c0_g1~~TRINITY_DN12207_c0_g1_i1.p2  ORF type:complete len:186 (+),score=58.16 TRINITY_DN12207_c0_g1_i1:322-879(+)